MVSACASIHPGQKALSTDPNSGVVLSVKVNNSLSDDHYLFLDYTVENTTPEWIKFKTSYVAFEDQKTEVLINERLKSWVESKELELQRQNYSRAILLGSIAAVGGVTGVVSNDETIQMAGLTTMAGALVVSGADDIGRAKNRVERGQKDFTHTVNVPDSYILKPFEVAPGSYLKRWIVVKKPKFYDPYSYSYEGPHLVTQAYQNENPVTFKVKL